MVTLVGNESELTDLLQNLVRLDYDAIDAYDAAIERLEDTKAQEMLRAFRKDHERHIADLTPHITGLGAEVPAGSGPKHLLTEGKVKVAALAGDSAILTAMATNEVETESAYRSASERDDVDGELAEKLRAGMADEARHKEWMKERA
ncbi:hypothetical protein T35B1_16293 [Salinisphaera shabanensis T35B1]|jgi:transcription elongation factor GreA-like protein|uniref:DUF2383 domain-containing protein n=1 Tax=Salinisphaera shabanensis E1L3A TaxID=1033802 RepID=U2FWZ9_9GAMM|nr:DUF2383 domain-containing protein [Salinisphaera shabanensis]ERJ20394.1 hypothetical protein SSPSH_000504 [Salinisphaera shabanensis E1L3A]